MHSKHSLWCDQAKWIGTRTEWHKADMFPTVFVPFNCPGQLPVSLEPIHQLQWGQLQMIYTINQKKKFNLTHFAWSHHICPGGGGTPLKYVTGMCGHIDPHFQTACHWMTPFLFFTFCSHLMTPIFKILSHLMTPFFRNIHRWKWASCSHWMTPIFTNKWPPRNMYPIFVWKEGFM